MAVGRYDAANGGHSGRSIKMVDAMVREFDRRDNFLLTIPPEGTRDGGKQWRTGFYYIALKAKVPLILGMMDYPKKTGGLGPSFMPSGDYKADMQKLSEFYHSVTPKFPEKAMRDIVSTDSGTTGNQPDEGEPS